MSRYFTRIARGFGVSTLALLVVTSPVHAQESDACTDTAERGWTWRFGVSGSAGGTGEVVAGFTQYAAGDLVVATSRMISGPEITYTFYVDNVAVGETEVPGSISHVIPTSGGHWVGLGTPDPFVGEVEITVACYSEAGLKTMIEECVPEHGLATALRNQIGGSRRAFGALVNAQAGRRISEECAERLTTAAGHLFGGSG